MSECPLCRTNQELILTLPCHPEHRACRQCLEKSLRPGYALKCAECREVVGPADLDLLDVHEGPIPEKQCCTVCFANNQSRELARYFCLVCRDALCDACRAEKHDVYFTGVRSHHVKDLTDFRTRSRLLNRQLCYLPSHHQAVLSLYCSDCSKLGCVHCSEHLVDNPCTQGGNHRYVNLMQPSEVAKERLKRLKASLQSKLLEIQEATKVTLMRMEHLREKCEEHVTRVDAQQSSRRELLNAEVTDVKTEINNIKQHGVTSTNGLKDHNDDVESTIQGILDGIAAVTQSQNAEYVIEREVELSRLGQVQLQLYYMPVVMALPELNEPEEAINSVLGLTLRQAAFVPTGIRPITAIPTPSKCYSVSISGTEQAPSYISCGHNYKSIRNEMTNSNGHCIRQVYGGNVLILETEPPKKSSTIVTYAQTKNDGGTFSYEFQSSFAVVHTSKLTHFAIASDTIIRTGASNKTLYFYNRATGRLKAEIHHPDMLHLWGICIVDDEVFFSDWKTGKIYAFEMTDVLNVRLVCGGLTEPAGMVFHRQHLYVVSNEIGVIYVLDRKGNLVTQLELPNLRSDSHDISISDSGLVAIANRDSGVQLFQLLQD